MQKCGGSIMLSLAGNDTTYALGSIFWILHEEVHSTDLNEYEVDEVKQDDFAKVTTFKKFLRDD